MDPASLLDDIRVVAVECGFAATVKAVETVINAGRTVDRAAIGTCAKRILEGAGTEGAPTYITPGMPRFRLPDFSVTISPVLPNSSGMPCTMALGINASKKFNMIYFTSFFSAFLRDCS